MEKTDLNKYKTIVFDCDGVVLNSNKIKTNAFYEAARVYGHESALALKDYHVKNGGVSRYQKFQYFLTTILGIEPEPEKLNQLLERFSREVKNNLLKCEIAEGLGELREKTKQSNWLIVSGGDQTELREVFSSRCLDEFFTGGIFGSPDTKETILKREIAEGNIILPGLFIGDSKYDFEASFEENMDFVFVSEWSEVECWENWVNDMSLSHVRCVRDL